MNPSSWLEIHRLAQICTFLLESEVVVPLYQGAKEHLIAESICQLQELDQILLGIFVKLGLFGQNFPTLAFPQPIQHNWDSQKMHGALYFSSGSSTLLHYGRSKQLDGKIYCREYR
uniref:Protein N-lysine methyltransferase METTL21A isoform X1 n=1 Tax=Rhizophora mucronata TaxID=61149 RepID=A0A2P2KW88_RHIMU